MAGKIIRGVCIALWLTAIISCLAAYLINPGAFTPESIAAFLITFSGRDLAGISRHVYTSRLYPSAEYSAYYRGHHAVSHTALCRAGDFGLRDIVVIQLDLFSLTNWVSVVFLRSTAEAGSR
ncbi:hypothetical protein BH20ACI2_BH20ACI2_24010 [soil metagenome]